MRSFPNHFPTHCSLVQVALGPEHFTWTAKTLASKGGAKWSNWSKLNLERLYSPETIHFPSVGGIAPAQSIFEPGPPGLLGPKPEKGHSIGLARSKWNWENPLWSKEAAHNLDKFQNDPNKAEKPSRVRASLQKADFPAFQSLGLQIRVAAHGFRSDASKLLPLHLSEIPRSGLVEETGSPDRHGANSQNQLGGSL